MKLKVYEYFGYFPHVTGDTKELSNLIHDLFGRIPPNNLNEIFSIGHFRKASCLEPSATSLVLDGCVKCASKASREHSNLT